MSDDEDCKITSSEKTHEPFMETNPDKANGSFPYESLMLAHDLLKSSDIDSLGIISIS